MASNPAINLEDQLDEDFFDKLANDDDDAELLVTPSDQISSDRSDSDEIKAFTKPGFDNSECKAGTVYKEVIDVSVEEKNSSPLSSKSPESDSLVQTENDNAKTEVNFGGNIGSAGSGVKEVEWSAFNVESEQSVGSYLDFYGELKDGADDPFENIEQNVNESKIGGFSGEINTMDSDNGGTTNPDTQDHSASVADADQQHDLNSTQYWESMYPGWKYDLSTGQWYQMDKNDNIGDDHTNSADIVLDNEAKTEVSSYLQQTTQSVLETISENGKIDYTSVNASNGTSENILNWNQIPEGNNGYPAHMVFDPQYPGWYYDTIAQEWRTLESYTSSVQPNIQAQGQPIQNGYGSKLTVLQNGDRSAASNEYNWNESYGNYNQQGTNMGTSGIGPKVEEPTTFSGNNQGQNHFVSGLEFNHHFSHNSTSMVPFHEQESQGDVHNVSDFSSASVSQGSHYGVNLSQQQNGQIHASHYYAQEQFQNSPDFSHTNIGRSSAGRPVHALVTFGFGGKLIVMKNSTNNSFSTSSYGGQQDSIGSTISVHNLIEVLSDRHDASCVGVGCYDYLDVLCRQSFPGPLAGGSISNKEVNRWIEEKIANCESHDVNYRKSNGLRSLHSLLKIAFQHYGNLRPPFGSEATLREGDVPETAVAMLFSSLRKNDAQSNDHAVLTHCLRNLPSEEQMQVTAAQVQSLLVFGKKKEALQCAIEGQLWSFAVVLAAQIGDQFYMDTVKQMAFHQLVPGSPLRTICLLIAGQLADVFSTDSPDSSIHVSVNMSPKCNTNNILDNWEDNLAVITANRTKDDELVLIHLGDCLWKDRSDIVAAHNCYILAEAKFEPYSDTARLCLVGSDHWRFPRTYANPEAIQRTELYEYSKVLGNSQFTLLPFQPYKLIYAHMLAEVGKLSESLKYCQAVSKLLRTGRSPEVETWKQIVSSLEERIRAHQQGGYTANLAPGKLVGKLLNLFDSTAHRVKGGKLPPIPSPTRGNSLSNNEHHDKKLGHRAITSQSSMAMSSLVPSDSVEPMSEWTGDRKAYNRSVSEPDFRRTTPKEGHTESSKEQTASRFSHLGRFSFGSQILQKTMDLVLKPRQERQAKLGETNKFYYDEKLKRWVEEGAAVPTEEAVLPPPPPTVAFQNGVSNYSLNSALGPPTNGSPEFTSPVQKNGSATNSIPPATNQFSAHRRTGVNSRYVDTFNKGGGNSTNLYKSAYTPPSVKSAIVGNPNFFVPTPAVTSGKEEFHHHAGFTNGQEMTLSNENSIPFSSQSNQTYNGHLYHAEVKPSGQQALAMSPPLLFSSPTAHLEKNVGSFGNELYEVEI
ncbi:protein transport protein SEC16B homolog [Impatiens glandulifera]|uniref:protein transport protein SEC16B homolog n=1 Tax=Impatiens glandulifera TaxID=253017 RepID=UPI001FB16E72|nr:protein transport protein SEC16B homolog [Impatiens glandulifera]